MRKAVCIVFCLLLLCVLITPAAAQYIWDPQPVYKGVETSIKVTNTFSETLTNCRLYFGDGTSSNLVDMASFEDVIFKHTYQNTGTYTLTFQYTQGSGQSTSDIQITVQNPQTVTITAGNTVILPNTDVSFSASSQLGTISSATWNFGDGSTTTVSGRTATHTYTTAGTYTVSVTATLSGGGTDSGSSSNLMYVVNPPTVSAVTISPSPQNVNNPVTASITYTAASSLPSGYTAYVHVDDGISTQNYAASSYSSPISRSGIVYDSQGTKTISAYGFISGNGQTLQSPTTQTATVSITPPSPGGLSFTMTPANGEIQVGDTVTFVATAGSGGSVTSYTWNFGDGSAEQTVSSSTTTHQYNAVNTNGYSVTVTANGPGGSTSYTQSNAVKVGETFVTLNKATYYIGTDTTIQANYSIAPYSSSSVYTLELWKLNDLYEPVTRAASIPLNAASGTQSFDISQVTANTNYNVYIVNNGGYIASAPATVRYNGDTLTVILYGGSTILTSQAQVLLQQNGATIQTVNTSTGQAVFAPLTRGATYTVVASSEGYADASTSVTMTGDVSVTINLGTSLNTGGWGQWEPLSCTWQIYDKYGNPISGAAVELQKVAESFGNIDIFNQWYTTILGDTLLGAPQTLYSDTYGRVTFNVFPSTYYRINVTYGDLTKTEHYTIGTTAQVYTISLGGAVEETKGVYQLVYASVESDQGDGTITVTYTDTASPKITSDISIKIYNSNQTVIAQWSAPANTANQVFTIQDRYNNDYDVQITANTSIGQYTKKTNVHFVGPRLNFGLPEGLLIWISVFLLFAVGGIFSRFTVGMGCMAISLIAWVLYGIGWLWQLESAVTGVGLAVILFFATLVSIMFMIAENR